jgi:hypothetical protein
MPCDPWTGFPFRAISLAAAKSAQAASKRLAIEMAPALPLLDRRNRNEAGRNDNKPK